MKITIATPVYPPEISLTAKYSKEIAVRLSMDNEVNLVAYANEAEDAPGIDSTFIKKSLFTPVRVFSYTQALWNATHDSDILYVQEAIASGVPALFVSFLRRLPLVLHLTHDEDEKRGGKNFLHKLLQKLVLSNANTVIVPSDSFGEAISKKYAVPQKKLSTIYTPPQKRIELPFDITEKNHSIIVVADLLTENQLKTIITTCAFLKKEFNDIHLTISGDVHDMDAVKELIDSLGLRDSATITGVVSRAEEWYLHQIHTLCIVGREKKECFYHMIENLSSKTVTIAHTTPCYREFITDKKTGLLINLDDTKELTEAVSLLFKDSRLLSTLREEGQRLFKKEYSWESHLDKLMRLFESSKK